jgi:hypothetical protein
MSTQRTQHTRRPRNRLRLIERGARSPADVTFMDWTGVHLLRTTFGQLDAQQRRQSIAFQDGGARWR